MPRILPVPLSTLKYAEISFCSGLRVSGPAGFLRNSGSSHLIGSSGEREAAEVLAYVSLAAEESLFFARP